MHAHRDKARPAYVLDHDGRLAASENVNTRQSVAVDPLVGYTRLETFWLLSLCFPAGVIVRSVKL